MGVGLSVERLHFDVAGAAIEGDGFAQGPVGLETQTGDAGFPRVPLEFRKKAAADTQATGGGGDPHPL